MDRALDRALGRIMMRALINKFAAERAYEPSSDDPERVNIDAFNTINRTLSNAWAEVEKEKYGCATATNTDAIMETLLASLLSVPAKKK